MKDKFIQFLKDNDAWEKYNEAVENIPSSVALKKINNEEVRCYISGSFMWINSKDGYNYWSNLNDKWHEYLTALNPA